MKLVMRLGLLLMYIGWSGVELRAMDVSLSVVNVKDEDGCTPLHRAARDGRKDEVVELLGKDADIKAVNSVGWTPLHLAADGGHREVVELLLANGADMKAVDNDGWAASAFGC